MSSVWDDPEIGEEDTTPVPDLPSAAPLTLAPEKLEALTIEVVERVVREIVPEIAERLVKQELDRLMAEPEAE
jgi:hypothetical protein